MLGVLLAVAALMIPLSGFFKHASESAIVLPPAASAAAQTVFSQLFELRGNRNVRLQTRRSITRLPILDIDLINEQK